MDSEAEMLTVEARVRAWKSLLVAIITMNVESAEAVHTLQFFESVERHLAGSSHELEQLGLFFLVE